MGEQITCHVPTRAVLYFLLRLLVLAVVGDRLLDSVHLGSDIGWQF